MEIVETNGIRLAVEIAGAPDGRPMMLLHGAGYDRSTWDPITPAFAEAHRTYAVDLRGFGDSDRPGHYAFEAMRDDILGLLERLDLNGVDLIGHSLGGTVAWLVAGQPSPRVGRLVIEDAPPPRRDGPRRERPEPPGQEPDQASPFDWEAIVQIVDQLNDANPQWWDAVARVSVPTLLVAGGGPSHIPQRWMVEAREQMADGRLVEVPVGHHIHRDAPEEFIAHVRAFFG